MGLFGAGMFFLTVLMVVFGHAFFSAEKTEEDRRLMDMIKEGIMFTGKKRH